MLKPNYYSITELEDLKDFFTVSFVIIDDIYQAIIPEEIQKRKNINQAILSDSEIITIALVGELLTIDSENAWFKFVKKNFKSLFPRLCDRSRFNRTRRNLHSVIGEIRKYLCHFFKSEQPDYRIIDSMPIPVCKFGRAHFHKTFKFQASYGYCPSKKETYYGFKLHVLTTFEGYITDFVLTKASIDDREAIWDLTSEYANGLTIIGDKGYINKELNPALKKERNIDLIFMQRNKCKTPYPKPFRQMIFKIRRRIETSFSQLTEQLNIAKVKAKSLMGMIARLNTKILAYNLCFYMNQCLGKDSDVSQIKQLIFG
ncbi:IS982 family transposase [Garciella nitratireducens]|uniref:IS982 family transposase n=1 Tax=Garciella nitratireducens TaxID=218205 RepID=UPI000DEB8345|nr:IS982 family transposase [Garciella nitratireducens]RBP35198.1 DDE family transposase [Garciella nitratireducens]